MRSSPPWLPSMRWFAGRILLTIGITLVLLSATEHAFGATHGLGQALAACYQPQAVTVTQDRTSAYLAAQAECAGQAASDHPHAYGLAPALAACIIATPDAPTAWLGLSSEWRCILNAGDVHPHAIGVRAAIVRCYQLAGGPPTGPYMRPWLIGVRGCVLNDSGWTPTQLCPGAAPAPGLASAADVHSAASSDTRPARSTTSPSRTEHPTAARPACTSTRPHATGEPQLLPLRGTPPAAHLSSRASAAERQPTTTHPTLSSRRRGRA
jgi:hypothetical protein